MSIRVEFFGVPRQRAGVAEVLLDGLQPPQTLGAALAELGRRYPQFAADCLAQDGLRSDYLANLDGRRFVRDPATLLDEGGCLLIMSADAGG